VQNCGGIAIPVTPITDIFAFDDLTALGAKVEPPGLMTPPKSLYNMLDSTLGATLVSSMDLVDMRSLLRYSGCFGLVAWFRLNLDVSSDLVVSGPVAVVTTTSALLTFEFVASHVQRDLLGGSSKYFE
jgi:hypothetical protein